MLRGVGADTFPRRRFIFKNMVQGSAFGDQRLGLRTWCSERTSSRGDEALARALKEGHRGFQVSSLGSKVANRCLSAHEVCHVGWQVVTRDLPRAVSKFWTV